VFGWEAYPTGASIATGCQTINVWRDSFDDLYVCKNALRTA
jgi:hypothetical protein